MVISYQIYETRTEEMAGVCVVRHEYLSKNKEALRKGRGKIVSFNYGNEHFKSVETLRKSEDNLSIYMNNTGNTVQGANSLYSQPSAK